MLHPTAVITCEWIFMTLAYIVVGARLWVRLYLKRTRLILADVFLLIALVSAQGLLVCDTLTYQMGQMNNFTDPDVRLKKIRFATNYLFDFGIYFPKFSILAFYYALVPSSERQMRMFPHILACTTVVSSLFTFFADTFWCGPDPASNWQGPEGSCSVFSSMELMRANWSLHFATEVLIVIYPFPIVANLMLQTKREKLALGLLFSMGFITIGVSIGRFVTMVYVDNAISIYIWATAELCIAIIIVALTALRPLFQKFTHLVSTSVSSSKQGPGRERSAATNSSGQIINIQAEPSPLTGWGRSANSIRNKATASRRSADSTASEAELMKRGIVKMQEITVTREAAPSSELTGSENSSH